MTNVVDINSELIRKSWLKDNLVKKVSQSFWAPYTGMGSDNVIYQVNMSSQGAGNTVIFDYAGTNSNKAVIGDAPAYGTGTSKRKYSDKVTIEEVHLTLQNGSKFRGKEVGDLTSAEHSSSVSILGDMWTRFKDQAIFDTLQGGLGSPPTHIYRTSESSFDFDELIKIEKAVKTGSGLYKPSSTGAVTTNKADKRVRLTPFKDADGKPIWLFVIDTTMATALKSSDKYQSLVFNGDIRGNDNRAITGIIGKIGSLVIVEALEQEGATSGAGTFGLKDFDYDEAGLRRYMTDGVIDTTTPLVAWSGQAAFDESASDRIVSRGLLIGAGAVQLGMGKQPDYGHQESLDYGRSSESALEVYMGVKQTILTQEVGSARKSKLADISLGVIAVDMIHNA